jgi:hypothetical protein
MLRLREPILRGIGFFFLLAFQGTGWGLIKWILTVLLPFLFYFDLRGVVLWSRLRDFRDVVFCFLLACQGSALGLKGQSFSRSRSAS